MNSSKPNESDQRSWLLLGVPIFYAAVGPALGLLIAFLIGFVYLSIWPHEYLKLTLWSTVRGFAAGLPFAYLLFAVPALFTGVVAFLISLCMRRWIAILSSGLTGGVFTEVALRVGVLKVDDHWPVVFIGFGAGLFSAIIANAIGLFGPQPRRGRSQNSERPERQAAP